MLQCARALSNWPVVISYLLYDWENDEICRISKHYHIRFNKWFDKAKFKISIKEIISTCFWFAMRNRLPVCSSLLNPGTVYQGIPSCLLPLFLNESSCKTFHTKNEFDFQNKEWFRKKTCFDTKAKDNLEMVYHYQYRGISLSQIWKENESWIEKLWVGEIKDKITVFDLLKQTQGKRLLVRKIWIS